MVITAVEKEKNQLNFKYMPELEVRWGYHASLGVMFLVTLAFMLYFFDVKKWI